MTDKVWIEGLRVDTVIGVFDWEKQIKQPLFIDLEIDWDHQRAGSTDELVYALDYGMVANEVTQLLQAQPRQLIERVAEDIATLILARFQVQKVYVKVAKPTAVPSAKQVAVSIIRQAK